MEVEIARIAYVYPACGIQRDGAIWSAGFKHRRYPFPGGIGGVIEDVIGPIKMADVRMVRGVQGKGGTPAYITAACHPHCYPIARFVCGVLEISVYKIAIADMRMAGGIYRY